MKRLSPLIALLSATLVAGDPFTPKHEAGRCAIRGSCGKKSFFGPELPCVDNGPAETPSDSLRSKLVDLCGPKWKDSDVCCTESQVEALEKNVAQANPIISACPACKDNFYNTFCTFTCSPDQSLFVNVTRASDVSQGKRVAELDQLISEDYGAGFFNSCKDVKFGPTNGNAMDFIGGGAKNYSSFLAFLGHESLLGSPFQINFPPAKDYSEPDMKPTDMKSRSCNDEDPNFRCACIDCPAVCPALPEIKHTGSCHVGVLPCLSFGAILSYGIFLLLVVTAIVGHIAWAKHQRSRSERLRLLQDAAASDDEDDDVFIASTHERGPRQYYLNTLCDSAFSHLGFFAAKFPGITIGTSVFFVALLSLGWINFAIETNPARLWVSPTSEAAQEKAYFDSHFGPFYRAEQAFLVNDTHETGPVLTYETLKWWFNVEQRVKELRGVETGVYLEEVCFKPTGDACVVQSVTGYFGDDVDMVDPFTWKEDLSACANSPVDCRPPFGQPMSPNMILGGWDTDPLTAPALIVTWVVNNFKEGTPEVVRAMDWEASMRSFLLDLQSEAADRGLRLSFSTEISLEEELNQSTNTDAKIVVISYIIMFFYASLALGSTTISLQTILRNPGTSIVQSKFTLGVVGILIVLMSISASVGLFSAVGIKVTLIIAEVIPFIVLAVGVDNIFLIVHEFERVNVSHADEIVEERVARALGRMGPSILLSATTETIAFALGAAVGMPAVRNFAVYAAGAVFINALLQVTMFISVLALNQRRVEDRRADCFPCVQVKSAGIHLGGRDSPEEIPRVYETADEGYLQAFIRKVYAPALLGRKVKTAIVVVFLGLFAAGVSLIPEVPLGLDQRVAIPDGSYLIPYFNDLYDYFDSGPPVYFVTRDVNVTQREHQQQLCSRFTTCEQESITNVLEVERKRSNDSYIAAPAASWIDDYLRWLNPEFGCCVENGVDCFADRDPEWNITLYGMPEGEEFIHYLSKWIRSPADEDCPLGGEAAYGNALVIDTEHTTVPASHFRTTHTPLRSQSDFIEAYASARRIANTISSETGVDVFPYSVFYIFFDQYATIVQLTATLIGAALAMILLISSILLGSVLTGAVVTLTVLMIVIDIIGTMAVAGVSLNAVSLVNLVICVGIGVEFCAHIARAFMFPSRGVISRAPRSSLRTARDVRAYAALVHVGGSVLSGITITKLLGVCVLAFTRSKIFDIYYFRIWLALVCFAAAHALVFLPVALSLLGSPEGYEDPDADGGIEEDLASRRFRAMVPDEEDSDDDGF